SVEKIKKKLFGNQTVLKDFNLYILSVNYCHREIIDQIAQLSNCDFSDYLSKNKPYLSSEQISKMIKDGFTFGGHSVEHPFYWLLSLSEQLYQTCESVRFLKEKFQLKYGAFAFPHGDSKVTREFFTELYSTKL